jgi:hypothetical protein
MAQADDEILFVCWPPQMLGEVTSGSVIRHCRTCLGEIWVASSTLKEIKKQSIRNPNYCCVPCVYRKALEASKSGGAPIKVMDPTEEQLEEFRAYARRRRQ